ncbi:MAG: hypothetical protein RL582_1974 [Bacteroidota bacterium]|jgi:hypothetical protein
MNPQHFGNHRKKAPSIYYFSLAVLLFNFLIWAWIAFFGGENHDKSMAFSLALISFASLILGYFARALALVAQDRAIRAEENLRHFVLAGKLHDSKLSLSQVIALRFASDDEFVELSKKAAEQNLKSTDIKKQIKNWKADHNRV